MLGEGQAQWRILAIDDNKDVHNLYRETFSAESTHQQLVQAMDKIERLASPDLLPTSKAGSTFDLDHAMSGQEGYECLLTAQEIVLPYAVVLLDMRMPPGWDGLETAKRIRALDPLVRIILVTAYSDYTLHEIREEIGVDFDLLAKPADPAELFRLTLLHARKWGESKELEAYRETLQHSHKLMELEVAERAHELQKAQQRTQYILDTLVHEKEQMEQILESMREGVVVVDRMGNILQINQKMERLTGKEELSITGHPLGSLFEEPSQAEINRTFNPRVLSTVQDRLQVLVDQQQSRFRSWIDSSLLATMLVDMDGTILVSSPAMEGICGQRANELIGKSVEQLLPVALREVHAGKMRAFMDRQEARSMGDGACFPILHRSGEERLVEIGLIPLRVEERSMVLVILHDPAEPQQWNLFQLTPFGRLFSDQCPQQEEIELDWQLKHADGSTIPVNVTGAPLYIEEERRQRFNGAVLVLHDLREILNRESRKLIRKAKEDFLASMSHELRTPLTTIIGNSEVLSETVLDRKQRTLLRSVEASSRLLLVLVNDVLDYSKLESGSFLLDEEDYDFNRLIDDFRLTYASKVADAGLVLKVVQRFRSSQKLQGDPRRLTQIINNLMSNALKFTEKGVIKLEVSLDEEMKIHIAVEDQGIGMGDEVLVRLFRPFEQADNSISRRFGGTGLGLYIAASLAQLMEGRIEVESEAGVGSRFELIFPYRTSDVSVHEEVRAANRFQGRVLVAEDTPEMQLLVRNMLESMGVDVTVVPDGEQAIDKALHDPFELILMDMQMPVMDGIEATRLLRNLGYQQPIVALTANVMEHHRRQFEEAGCDLFLGKPIDRKRLRGALQQYLQPAGEGGEMPLDSEEVISEELQALFMERMHALHKELMIGLLDQNWSNIRSVAHNFKGSGASFGYPELSESGKMLCSAIDQNHLENATLLVERLSRELGVALHQGE